ncbi:hypothetical protein QV65_19065 [Rhodococcus erythropolis]|nr:hypothetical protein QV65_19065 [Rhodococcus erythropolis]
MGERDRAETAGLVGFELDVRVDQVRSDELADRLCVDGVDLLRAVLEHRNSAGSSAFRQAHTAVESDRIGRRRSDGRCLGAVDRPNVSAIDEDRAAVVQAERRQDLVRRRALDGLQADEDIGVGR